MSDPVTGSSRMSEGKASQHVPSEPSPLAQGPTSPRVSRSPGFDERGEFRLPSPLPTRRLRSNSVQERAKYTPQNKGRVKYFCRQRGHGFITPNGGGEPVFLHISDIEGELVPHENDDVVYQLTPMPPKMEKYQAVHVRIVNLAPGKHQRWTDPAEAV